ncbi:hypothetical protein MTO96_044364, partial [Rhipicephalus appendiculatus]
DTYRNTCRADTTWGYKVVSEQVNCSKRLGYICRKNKSPVTHGFDCEYASTAQSTLRPVCVRNIGRNFPESIKECAKLGMDLIPIGLQQKEYKNIVNNYFLQYMVSRPHLALWVDVPQSHQQKQA